MQDAIYILGMDVRNFVLNSFWRSKGGGTVEKKQ